MANGYRPNAHVSEWQSASTTPAHWCPGNPPGKTAARGPLVRVLTIPSYSEDSLFPSQRSLVELRPSQPDHHFLIHLGTTD